MGANTVRDALLPELQPRFADGWLHHPLIVGEVRNCDEANRANDRYRTIKDRERELRTNPGDGLEYVFIHERPYRFGALQRIAPQLNNAIHYWKLVGEVWTDSENIRQHFAGWQRVWSDSRSHKQECMTPKEQVGLEGMPAFFPVWRGVGFRGQVRGLSWTVDRDIAVWYAQRYDHGRHSKLIHAEVRRRDVHAFFQGRRESEIVASHVRILQIESLR